MCEGVRSGGEQTNRMVKQRGLECAVFHPKSYLARGG